MPQIEFPWNEQLHGEQIWTKVNGKCLVSTGATSSGGKTDHTQKWNKSESEVESGVLMWRRHLVVDVDIAVVREQENKQQDAKYV